MKRPILLFAMFAAVWRADAGPLQLLTQQPTNQLVMQGPLSGGGDSLSPVISPDGRYVVFASRAENLISNLPPTPPPTSLQVYVRDRVAQQTKLVSVNVSGTGGGNGDSIPTDISADGRYVLFESFATNLVAGDTNNGSDVFIRDLVSDATELVSVAVDGGFGNGPSRTPVMTPDGRFVAFASVAKNLVNGDSNGMQDIFVRDMQLGTTTMASVGATSIDYSSHSASPLISPDGRYVAFWSSAKGLFPSVTTPGEIYVRDLVNARTFFASTNGRAIATPIVGTSTLTCYGHVMSDDGQVVTYEIGSGAVNSVAVVIQCQIATGATTVISSNSVPLPDFENGRNIDMTPDGRLVVYLADTNYTFGTRAGVYMWDALSNSTTLVSVDKNGAFSPGVCDWPTIDASGRYVAFFSTATNLAANLPAPPFLPGNGLYVRDLVSQTTTWLKPVTPSQNPPANPVTSPSLSTNGLVAFDSVLVESPGTQSDVFVGFGDGSPTETISVRDSHLPSVSPVGQSALTSSCLSSNGLYFAYSTRADDQFNNDSNTQRDVYVEDRTSGRRFLLSANTSGAGASGPSLDPSISADGRFVAFTSRAPDLITNYLNHAYTDVYVRDLIAGTTALVSVAADGHTLGNNSSSSASVSGDGRFVLFHSLASNLGVPTGAGIDNLYLRDVVAQTTKPLTTNASGTIGCGAMSPGGRYLCYVGTSNSSPCLFVHDLQTNQRISATTIASGAIGVGVSANGSRAAAVTSAGITVVKVGDGSVTNLPDTSPRGILRFSADGKILVYAHSNIYACFVDTGFTMTITHGYDGSAANGTSDFPDISADGRYVTFVSSASNLVTNDFNGLPDVFLYEVAAPPQYATKIVSAGLSSNTAAGRSLTPYFSPDGQTLVFESWAGDIVAQDFNQFGDLFAFNVATIAPVYPGDPVLTFVTPVTFSGMTTTSGGVTFSWAVDPTRVYTVEYKDDLNDPQWHEFAGATSVIGNTQYAQDMAAASQRFYRVVVQ